MSDSLPPGSRVFIDTSAYVALVRIADGQHQQARHIMDRIVGARVRLFITNFVIAEIHAFLVTRSGIPLATRFVREVGQSTINVVRVGVEDEERAKEIILQYNDKDFSYTDATSFAVMDRLDIQYAFSFDHHFRRFGFILLPDLI